VLPVAEPLGRYAPATLACAKGSGCNLDSLAHTVGAREIGLRSAFRESLDGLLPLVAGQSRRAPKTHATGLGPDTAVAGTSISPESNSRP
jgi:hypothetical protein